MPRHLYVPSQVPALHVGVAPEQASLDPHLHTPVSQVFELPEQSASVAHSAIQWMLKYNYMQNVLKRLGV